VQEAKAEGKETDQYQFRSRRQPVMSGDEEYWQENFVFSNYKFFQERTVAVIRT
jgi:hypothetical protein